MGKNPRDLIASSQMTIVNQAYKSKNGVSISEVAQKCNVSQETIKRYVKGLVAPIVEIKDGKIYAVPTGLEAIWSHTTIGKRLSFGKEEKSKLAEAAVSFIKEHKGEMGNIVLGSGTTILRCACELMTSASCFESLKIHTANLLVLHEFVWHKPETLSMELPGGDINWNTGTLCGEHLEEYFKTIEVQGVVTSFSDMSFEKGFCTIHDDIKEKLANLKPNPETCKWVIIPIAWRKIGHSINTHIAKSRGEQLDFVGDKRKYVIITDRPPENEWDAKEDNAKLGDLLKWKKEYKEGIEIYTAPELIPIIE